MQQGAYRFWRRSASGLAWLAVHGVAASAVAESGTGSVAAAGYGAVTLKLAVGLLAVLCLAYAILRAARFSGMQDSAEGQCSIRVLARQSIEPRRRLLLVEVGSDRFLLASTERGIETIGRVKPMEEQEAEEKCFT